MSNTSTRIRSILFIGALALAAVPVGAEVNFETEIVPILESKCFDCHSSLKKKPNAGLRLDTKAGIRAGGDGGALIQPRNALSSMLYQRVTLPPEDIDIMPPEGKGQPLGPEEVKLIEQWIDEGAYFGDWRQHKFPKKTRDRVEAAPATDRKDAPTPDWAKPSTIVPSESVPMAAGQIDQLVREAYATHEVTPNELTDDYAFVRRVYLDAIGRIPTYEEVISFADSKSPKKRAELIDSLLDSEGYVSRQFNFWADVLRVETPNRGGVTLENYQDWIKDSLRNDKPYTEFVRDLLVAEGHVYENGAAGYYLRDYGMPLDNMANTVQVFLGTQLACAQCHNHPFDKWTQREFFEMSSFTYGVVSTAQNNKTNKMYRAIQKMDVDNEVKNAANRLARTARFGYVSDSPKRQLRLPDNYHYDDAKPKDRVDPATIFGEPTKIKDPAKRRQAYADWMTSTHNPRFTAVIANRLWKQVFGYGLINPVDDLKDDTEASNPRLMAYLGDLMRSVDYSQKDFLRVLYNTQTYQRSAAVFDVTSGDPYYFPGPVLRRMKAEQMWDSLMTLVVPDIDNRKGQRRYVADERMAEIREIEAMNKEQLLAAAEKIVADRKKKQGGNSGGAMMMEESMMESAKPKAKKPTASAPSQSNFQLAANTTTMNAKKKAPAKPKRPKYPTGFVRASELRQPAPPGHFLAEFGQSDRQTIDASNDAPNVPQILQLLNGTIYNQLAARHSVLNMTLQEKRDGSWRDRVEALFIMIYSRPPSEREVKLAADVIARDEGKGLEDLVWALLNTQRFMFVQ